MFFCACVCFFIQIVQTSKREYNMVNIVFFSANCKADILYSSNNTETESHLLFKLTSSFQYFPFQISAGYNLEAYSNFQDNFEG